MVGRAWPVPSHGHQTGLALLGRNPCCHVEQLFQICMCGPWLNGALYIKCRAQDVAVRCAGVAPVYTSWACGVRVGTFNEVISLSTKGRVHVDHGSR